MGINRTNSSDLPLKRKLSPFYITSSIIAGLVAIVSVSGLLYHNTIYPTDDLVRAFLPNDVVNILIGLPVLLVSLCLTKRGKLVGLLLWPGALFFMIYNYLIYIFAMPLDWAFLLHLVLVALSVYSIIGLVASIDCQSVSQQLAGVVPERFAGGVLTGLSVLFLIRAAVVLINAIMGQAPLTESELALNATDFLTSPAWIIGGILLWNRKAFGYVVGLGLLFQASMLFIGLIVVLLLHPMLLSIPLAVFDILVIFIMGMICFIPFVLFIRGVTAVRIPASK